LSALVKTTKVVKQANIKINWNKIILFIINRNIWWSCFYNRTKLI